MRLTQGGNLPPLVNPAQIFVYWDSYANKAGWNLSTLG